MRIEARQFKNNRGRPLRLDPECYEAFWRRGWTVVEGAFCGEQVDRIAARVDSICDETIDEVADSRFLADRSDHGQVAPRKIGMPFFKYPDLRAFALSPTCVGKGWVVFHYSKTLHTSRRNELDQWRRAYATYWCSGDVASESDIICNAYFNAHSDLYDEALHAAQED